MVVRAWSTPHVGFAVWDTSSDYVRSCRTSDNVVGSGTISNNAGSESRRRSGECRAGDSNFAASPNGTPDRNGLHPGSADGCSYRGTCTSSDLRSSGWRLWRTGSSSGACVRSGLWSRWSSSFWTNRRGRTTSRHSRSSCCTNSAICGSASGSSIDAAANSSAVLRLSRSCSASSTTSSTYVRRSRQSRDLRSNGSEYRSLADLSDGISRSAWRRTGSSSGGGYGGGYGGANAKPDSTYHATALGHEHAAAWHARQDLSTSVADDPLG